MTKSELIAELSAANPHLRGQDVELIVFRAGLLDVVAYESGYRRGVEE